MGRKSPQINTINNHNHNTVNKPKKDTSIPETQSSNMNNNMNSNINISNINIRDGIRSDQVRTSFGSYLKRDMSNNISSSINNNISSSMNMSSNRVPGTFSEYLEQQKKQTDISETESIKKRD